MNRLAHLGGIDEIGIYVVPVVVAFLALRWVEKRSQGAGQRDEWRGSNVGSESDV
ncbi:MAG: hypothetical protein ABR609_02870 [Acidimicrobiia bacterium]